MSVCVPVERRFRFARLNTTSKSLENITVHEQSRFGQYVGAPLSKPGDVTLRTGICSVSSRVPDPHVQSEFEKLIPKKNEEELIEEVLYSNTVR